MKAFAKQCMPVSMVALALTGALTLASIPVTQAQEMTTRALIDRAQIQDLITRYYYNFGKPNPEDFSDFYADDAELILGTTHFKGKEGIEKAYGRGGGNGGARSSSASGSGGNSGGAGSSGGNNALRQAYAFNVIISNPLIIVHGETATSELIFTEYLTEKQGDVPHVRAQGREYATFVKVHGRWRYKTRQIKGGTEPPEGWKE